MEIPQLYWYIIYGVKVAVNPRTAQLNGAHVMTFKLIDDDSWYWEEATLRSKFKMYVLIGNGT